MFFNYTSLIAQFLSEQDKLPPLEQIPLYKETTSGDENWDDRFWYGIFNGPVYTVAFSGNDVYVGGWFKNAGDEAANRIARWNGGSWSALGNGFDNGHVYAICMSGDKVYAGGDFSWVGGVNMYDISVWDGSAWAPLGSGLGSGATAIAAGRQHLYVGSAFTEAGDKPSFYFAIYHDQMIDVKDTPTAVIKQYELYQNYPNPFNPSTVIKYSIPKASQVELKVFDLLGRELKVLVTGKQEAASYQVQFESQGLPAGLYFYRLRAGEFCETKKMVIVK